MKLKFIKELIKFVKSIPEKDYDQREYLTDEKPYCMAHHYEIEYGFENDIFTQMKENGVNNDELQYLTGYPKEVTEIASKRDWPVFGESINKTNALQRLNFIKSQIKKQS